MKPTNQPVATDFRGWMDRVEKSVLHEQRRPRITKAQDLLGPGFGPHTLQLRDWNAEAARFNGFFFSDVGALNAPEPDTMFLGITMGSADGHAVQVAWAHDPHTLTPVRGYTRSMHTHVNALPLFEDWQVIGTETGTIIEWAGADLPAGYLETNGTVYQVATHPHLAARLGSRFGGDGVTTFAVPDMPDPAPGVRRLIRR